MLCPEGEAILMSIRKLYPLFQALAYAALGIVLIVWPETSALTICYAIGAVLLALGLAYSISYFVQNHHGLTRTSTLVNGLLLFVIGLVVLLRAQEVLKALPFLFGLLLLVDSVFKVQAALDLRHMNASYWKVPLFIGLVTACLGATLIWNPFEAVVALNIFIGVCMLLDAVFNCASAILVAYRTHAFRRIQTEAQESIAKE